MKLDREMVKLAMAYQGTTRLRGFLKGQKEAGKGTWWSTTMGSFYGRGHAGGVPPPSGVKRQPGKGVSDGEALKWLLQTSGMPETVRRHSEAVSRKALDMAVRLGRSGICLNLELVRSAALLHDIGRASPITPGGALKFSAEAVIPWRPRSCASTTIWIVYHLRRMKRWWYTWLTSWCRGEREVSLEERLSGGRIKCAGSREAMEHFERRRLQARRALQVWGEQYRHLSGGTNS